MYIYIIYIYICIYILYIYICILPDDRENVKIRVAID